MKSFIKLVALLFIVLSCTPKKNKDVENVSTYNKELKEVIKDSNRNLDTALINLTFNKNEIQTISPNDLKEIAGEQAFKDLLKTEKAFLSKWEPIANFKSAAGIKLQPTPNITRRCGTLDRAPDNAPRRPVASGARAISLDYYVVEVPIAFHIIANSARLGLQGNMKQRIVDQINTLNRLYRPFRISFKLNSIDTSINDRWYNNASENGDAEALHQMTAQLSKNPARFMNVYTLNLANLGESTFPWYPTRQTSLDYVLINYNTLSGGPANFQNGNYTGGKTLVHEAGHFLGVLHTFEGGDPRFQCNSPHYIGCANRGDQVDDTPSQKNCYFEGCDENLDSCPQDPGKDPVKNYMGYNPDACMNQFTRGQGDRLLQSIINFRFYLITNP